MMSCGPTKEKREEDLTNLLSNEPCDNTVGSDLHFCEDQTTVVNCTSNAKPEGFNGKDKLMKRGTYAATIAFLSLGLLFTVVSAILSFFQC